jgi:hypothetical protein
MQRAGLCLDGLRIPLFVSGGEIRISFKAPLNFLFSGDKVSAAVSCQSAQLFTKGIWVR